MAGFARRTAIGARVVVIVAMAVSFAQTGTSSAWAVTYGLFQTQEDFSYSNPTVPYDGPVQDPSGGFILSTTNAFDADGATISAQTGSVGTAGSLQLAPNGSGNFSSQLFSFIDPNSASGYSAVPYNANSSFVGNFFSAFNGTLGGVLSYSWARPTSLGAGTYFGVFPLLNFSGGGYQYVIPLYSNGGETVTNSLVIGGVPYTQYTDNIVYQASLSAYNASANPYLQVGFVYNSDFYANNLNAGNPLANAPFYMDNITARPINLGDINLDGSVNAKDIAAMEAALAVGATTYASTHYMPSLGYFQALADLNHDGQFTNADLQKLLGYLIAGNGSASAVPEPASLVLLGLAAPALVAAARRYRKV